MKPTRSEIRGFIRDLRDAFPDSFTGGMLREAMTQLDYEVSTKRCSYHLSHTPDVEKLGYRDKTMQYRYRK